LYIERPESGILMYIFVWLRDCTQEVVIIECYMSRMECRETVLV